MLRMTHHEDAETGFLLSVRPEAIKGHETVAKLVTQPIQISARKREAVEKYALPRCLT
jgi:hypothetical protein